MFVQELILAIIILAYLAFSIALIVRLGNAVSARWSQHKRPERHQPQAKILYFPSATSRQNRSSSVDDRRASVLRKRAENL
jgi:hypothetical protein